MHVEETLARALDMYITKTSPRSLAGYVAEQANLPKPYYLDETRAIEFIVKLVLALTPPDDRRMRFRERPFNAAKAATPWDYGEAIDTLMELGWGGTPVDLRGAASVRDVGEQLREVLHAKAEETARKLLELWERNGTVFRL